MTTFILHSYEEHENTGMSSGIEHLIEGETPENAIEWYITKFKDNPYHEITIEATEEFDYITSAYRINEEIENEWEIHKYIDCNDECYQFIA